MARVLVTGGAKRLGGAITRALASAGHAVVIHYGKSREAAETLAGELGGATVQGDLSDPSEMPALFERACAGGPVDWLVNSASMFEYDAPGKIDQRLAAKLFAVNCLAPAELTAALAEQGRAGAVVNLLDQKLANPNPDYFSYTLSKAALAEATTLTAQAFAPGIRVNAVAPGLTLPSGGQSAAEFDAVASRNLLAHPVGASRVAEAVLYLLNAQAVTGQTLFVDCGQRFLKRDGDVMFDTAARP